MLQNIVQSLETPSLNHQSGAPDRHEFTAMSLFRVQPQAYICFVLLRQTIINFTQVKKSVLVTFRQYIISEI